MPALLLRLVAFGFGLWLVGKTLSGALRTFVLPRSSSDRLTGMVFLFVRRLLMIRLYRVKDYRTRDRVLAMYAPLALLMLIPAWMALVLLGFAAMFWAAGVTPIYDAIILSGSALFTLGFARSDPALHILLNFSESAIGLILVALLMAYLPTMYGAFQERERAVSLLEVRAGSPPSAVTMLLRLNRLEKLDNIHDMWVAWEEWFAQLQESHTSLAALVFFRSPRPEQSWLTAAGAILDSGALLRAAVDVPPDYQVDLCLRAGYLALRSIAKSVGLPYNTEPHFPDDPISVSRAEFDAALDELAEAGVPLRADREKAWLDFAGWRVNYDMELNSLARMTEAPPAPWVKPRYRYPDVSSSR